MKETRACRAGTLAAPAGFLLGGGVAGVERDVLALGDGRRGRGAGVRHGLAADQSVDLCWKRGEGSEYERVVEQNSSPG